MWFVRGGKLQGRKSKRICRNKFEYELGRFRYAELRNFCRQYADKKAEAELMLGVKSPQLSAMPHGTEVGDPVVRAAERRAQLLADCELIERCAREVDGGIYYNAIIVNVCMGKAYDYIPQETMPTGNRNAYFHARRQFFRLLDKAKR